MVIHRMRPFGVRSQSQRDDWGDLVALCEDMLVLARYQPGTLAADAGYLFERTGGSIGSLRALVTDAATRAILDGTETVHPPAPGPDRTDLQAHETAERVSVSVPSRRRRRAP